MTLPRNTALGTPALLTQPNRRRRTRRTHTLPAYAFKRLRERGFESYAAYLQSSEWAAVKWRYQHSKLPQTCSICGDNHVDLHHRSYKRIGGDEHLGDLVPLCREHHELVHQEHRTKRADTNIPSSYLYDTTNKVVKRERKQQRRKQNNHRTEQ